MPEKSHPPGKRPKSAVVNRSEQNRTESLPLTPSQRRAMTALAESNSIKAAAKQTRVGRTTIYKWLKEPLFLKALDELRQQLFVESIAQIKAASSQASRTLIALMDSEDERIRMAACKEVINASFRAYEIIDGEQRLKDMQNKIESYERSRNK